MLCNINTQRFITGFFIVKIKCLQWLMEANIYETRIYVRIFIGNQSNRKMYGSLI